MFIIGLVLVVFAVIAFVVSVRNESNIFFIIGIVAVILGLAPGFFGTIIPIGAYYCDYPNLETFYDSNAGNYQVVVERQNEIAVMNLEGPAEGEFFDGSDFSQSKETSNRYREYRDAANEYNLMLARYRRQGGTFLFWPMPQPNSRLKPIELK